MGWEGAFTASFIRSFELMMFLVARKRKHLPARSKEIARQAPAGLSSGRLIRPAVLGAMPFPWPPEVDCDELAMYGAALLLAMGVPCQFVTVSTDPKDPTRFTHIYVQAIREDGTKVLDFYGPEPGWEPHYIRRKEWEIMRPGSQSQEEPSNPSKK